MSTKIRIEPFGSLVYLSDSATTVELDKDETAKHLGYKGKFPDHDKGVMAPKIVHMEITNRCNMSPLCSYCYAKPEEILDLETDQWKHIMKDLSKSGVFQVTFGGGEPLLREDVFDLANYCRKKAKMNLGMTTNGLHILPDDRLTLFNQINLSVHNNWDLIRWKSVIVRNYAKVGISFLCRQDEMHQLDNIYDFIKYQNSAKSKHQRNMELLLLAYKPVIGDVEQIVPNSEIMKVGTSMAKDIPVAVDGYTCNRCEGGYSFIDVGSDGSVYPCSFIRDPVGNLLQERLLDIWKRVPTITKCPYGE